jgi:hypothetical protein
MDLPTIEYMAKINNFGYSWENINALYHSSKYSNSLIVVIIKIVVKQVLMPHDSLTFIFENLMLYHYIVATQMCKGSIKDPHSLMPHLKKVTQVP